MIDVNKILGGILDSPAKQGFAGGLAGGVLGGALTSKSGRKMGKKAVKYGAVAAVGALAYNAWRKHQETRQPGGSVTASPAAGAGQGPVAVGREPAPRSSGFHAETQAGEETNKLGMTLVRAMIAAARADGKLDPQEMQAIVSRIEESDLSAEEKGVLVNELSRPLSLDDLVQSVASPQEAAEVYVASLLAIEVDTAAEKAYLAMLAARLGLEDGLVEELHRHVAEA